MLGTFVISLKAIENTIAIPSSYLSSIFPTQTPKFDFLQYSQLFF